MNRAIIIHCWEGYPEYCWYPYVKKELEAKGFEVKVPAFPDTDNPKQDAWVALLEQEIGIPGENLYLIGHSIGCAAILRYLEIIDESEKIGGAVFVAGFTEEIGYKEIENFFENPFDFEKIKRASKNGFVAIHSDDDPYVDLRFSDIFKEKLDAEVIVKKNMGHFSGAIENEKACLELPDVVEGILKIAK
ncbi:alpha/beta hydrolase [Candidatus Giovannonibacteria bacterium]|nr:alpha/beta hydrolase [Candidatus Giovannonibacteria bacterium]